MIIDNKNGMNILENGEKRIAFAVNAEGINDAGFAGVVARKYWPELANIGPKQLGTVLSRESEGVTFYALVCHSLKNGWRNQTQVIRECFDNIDTTEPVASISIGTGFIGLLSGADFSQIKQGMEESKTQIILY